jgi:predicted nucleic acid-binding protein
MTILELVRRHHHMAVDANVLIYVQEDAEPMASIGRSLLDAVEAGAARGVMSVIGLAEVAAGPARSSAPADVERIVDEVRSIKGLHLQSVTAEIAVDAGVLRGVRAVPLPDAIHLASARAAGATAFVTNDRRLRSSAHLEVVYLDDLEVDEDPAPWATPV